MKLNVFINSKQANKNSINERANKNENKQGQLSVNSVQIQLLICPRTGAAAAAAAAAVAAMAAQQSQQMLN